MLNVRRCADVAGWLAGWLKTSEGASNRVATAVLHIQPCVLSATSRSFLSTADNDCQHLICMRRSVSSSILVRDCILQSRRATQQHAFRSVRRAHSSSDGAHRDRDDNTNDTKEEGAMTRRLSEMSEHSLETGGKAAQRAVDEAGFSEELKARLQEKIANASVKTEHAAAFAQATLPRSAGAGTVRIATAQPWMGTESVEDATLRMLDDAHKPLRSKRPFKPPPIRGPPKAIDTGRPSSKAATGTRLANARDKTSVYSFLKDSNLSDEEREKYRKELKERFSPTARALPATIQGLQSLANERIEDAIARGQFKNIPRGKTIERDYNASNPFLDTTEYFMNKMIQKQEIVPPWIEKQQELAATAARFRAQLRGNWRRHVARTIASRGGSLSTQMQLAQEYAFAEREESRVQAMLADESVKREPAASSTEPAEDRAGPELDDSLSSAELAEHLSQISPSGEFSSTSRVAAEGVSDTTAAAVSPAGEEDSDRPSNRAPSVRPFRDTQWEANEFSYHTVAIQNLNNLARSYNLMAPDLAKKPYFSLARELKSCFADVAPQVAEAIRERAMAPPVRGIEVIGHKPGGVMEKFSMDRAAHVYDEKKPQYGFKEFWRDLFTKS